MESGDLPTLKLVGRAAKVEELARMIVAAVNGSTEPFTQFDIIRGEPCSGRVLSRKLPVLDGFVSLDSRLMAGDLARELLDGHLVRECRYSPPEASERFQRGWEVSTGVLGNHEVVVVRASWVES